MPENKDANIYPWIIGIVVIVIALAGFHWWQVSGEGSSADQYYSTTPPSGNSNDIGLTIPPIASSSAPVQAPTTSTSNNKNLMHTVTLQTTKGTIVFETYDADAPKASSNFISLAQKGFYNGLIFHRVISGFMIQGGDPTGTGRGGPGYSFEDELDRSTVSGKTGYVRGTVAMANSGPNTNGSQFFIMHKDMQLQYNYTIFGKVISGMDVVDAIAASQVDGNDRPLTPIAMTKVTVAEKK
jgi:cyclophilin family peptidyl-prolyl cis-trans isomerase